MPFLDTLRSLDAKATPSPWRAQRQVIGQCLAVKAWHGHDAHNLYAPFLVRGRFSDQMYSEDWQHCGEGGMNHGGPDSDYVPVDLPLIVLLRNHAARIAAVVEAATRLRDSASWGDQVEPSPLGYPRRKIEAHEDLLTALDAALNALDKEAP